MTKERNKKREKFIAEKNKFQFKPIYIVITLLTVVIISIFASKYFLNNIDNSASNTNDSNCTNEANCITLNKTQDYQIIESIINGHEFMPQTQTIKRDKPVRWIVNAPNGVFGPMQIIVITGYLKYNLQKGENIIEFTPKEIGEVEFTCLRGLTKGKFIIEE